MSTPLVVSYLDWGAIVGSAHVKTAEILLLDLKSHEESQNVICPGVIFNAIRDLARKQLSLSSCQSNLKS